LARQKGEAGAVNDNLLGGQNSFCLGFFVLLYQDKSTKRNKRNYNMILLLTI